MRVKDHWCEGPACDRHAVVRDKRSGLFLCQAHYQQSLVRPDLPLRPLRARRARKGGCTDPEGCDGAHYALGLCLRHYMRRWRRVQARRQKERNQ